MVVKTQAQLSVSFVGCEEEIGVWSFSGSSDEKSVLSSMCVCVAYTSMYMLTCISQSIPAT